METFTTYMKNGTPIEAQEFDGKLYRRYPGHRYFGRNKTKDEGTGVIRLHRAVWEYYHGEIPKGFAIHHKDHNTENNDISNLQMISFKEHMSYHSKKQFEDEGFKKRFHELGIAAAAKAKKTKEWSDYCKANPQGYCKPGVAKEIANRPGEHERRSKNAYTTGFNKINLGKTNKVLKTKVVNL